MSMSRQIAAGYSKVQYKYVLVRKNCCGLQIKKSVQRQHPESPEGALPSLPIDFFSERSAVLMS